MTKKESTRLESVRKSLLENAFSNRGTGILRKFMSTDEKKMSNELVKEGLFDKGIADEKHGTTAYFLTYKGNKSLNNK